MGEPWKYYANWKKSNKKTCIVWLHLHKMSRIDKFIGTEDKSALVQELELEGEWANSYKVS